MTTLSIVVLCILGVAAFLDFTLSLILIYLCVRNPETADLLLGKVTKWRHKWLKRQD
jgi:hypothetical protein